MAIDTLKVAKRLHEAGFTEPQAEAVTAAVQEATQGAELATKADLAELRAELKAEIGTLKQLEALAVAVRRSGTDRKWRELANLLSEIFSPTAITNSSTGNGANGGVEIADSAKGSAAPKLVIFTEHRDTLSYLKQGLYASRSSRGPWSSSTAAWAGKNG